jgi:hypothetical protein
MQVDRRNFLKNAGLACVAGGVAIAGAQNAFASTVLTNNYIQSDEIKAPTGRAATIVIAASDSTADEKAQADLVCDGIADNVEIQAAIDACESIGGGKILITGHFVGGQLVFSGSNIVLQGQGASTVYTAADGMNTDIIRVGDGGTIADIHDFEIRNIQIDGNNANQSAGSGILFDANVNHSIISDVKIVYCFEHGIEIVNPAPSLTTAFNDIINTFVYGCGGDGIRVTHSHGLTLSNIVSNFNTGSGIYLVQSNSFHLSDVWLNGNLNGLYLYLTNNSFVINLNTASSVDIGIKLIGSGYTTFVNCVIEDTNGSSGMSCVTYSDFVNLYGCFFPYNDYEHLRLSGSHNCNITNCIFGSASQYTNNAVPGVRIMGDSTNNTFSGCTGFDKSVSGKLPTYMFLESTDGGNSPNNNSYINNKINPCYNTGLLSLLGANNCIQNNLGYVTENTGTATITASETTVDVTHGLAAAPTRVILSPTADTDGKAYWVSAKGASTFTITVDSASGGDISFDWQAVV